MLKLPKSVGVVENTNSSTSQETPQISAPMQVSSIQQFSSSNPILMEMNKKLDDYLKSIGEAKKKKNPLN